MLTRLIAIVVLLLLNGYFVAAEFALVRARRTRLEAMARGGDRLARIALHSIGDLGRMLSMSQVGITLSSLALGALTEETLAGYFEHHLEALPVGLEIATRAGIASAVALTIVTFFHVVLGELIPRSFALRHPERMARWLAPTLIAFELILRPLTAVMHRSADLFLRMVRQPPLGQEEIVHSSDELRILIEHSEERGALHATDATMIEGVFEFSEKNAREVMTPRTDIDALAIEATLDEVFELVQETRRSRYPVYEETIDNIVGMILTKDLIPLMRDPPDDFNLRAIMRPVHVVPGSREVEDVLADFKRLKAHLAVVLDEYGGTAGVVTMEDLLEEIVGDILDEYDEAPDYPVREGADIVVMSGATHIGELNERFGLSIPDEDYTTIGGFIFGVLGRLPTVGDRVTAGNAVLTVREMDGRRVDSIAVDLHSAGDRRADSRAPDA